MDELAKKLGPEYVALMGGLQDINPNSQVGQEIGSVLGALDKLCAMGSRSAAILDFIL